MANIVVSFYNFLLRSGNLSAMPPFYEAFIKGLESSGNNILCFQWENVQLTLNKKIPQKYLEKIKAFKPDLFIFFNNQFWDITKCFDQPIIVYDVDSPNAYCNLDILKENNERYKFIVIQSTGKQYIQDTIGCSEQNIQYVYPFTEIQAEEKIMKNNITFCGSNWFSSDFRTIYDFAKSNHSEEDKNAARMVYNLYLQNPTMTAQEIYKKFDIGAENQIKFLNLFYHACRVSGIERLRILSEIADLGLEIRGQYWLNDVTILSYPEILFSYSPETIHSIQDTANFYNSSKLSINTKHIQAKSGFSWRVCDILASNSCLVTQPASDIVNLGFNVPIYNSPAEAREVCKKLLDNENMRKDIVLHSQEIINKKHRFKHILPLIEEFSGVTMHSDNIGKIDYVIMQVVPRKVVNSLNKISFNQFPNIPTKDLGIYKKICYKLSRYFFKKFTR